MCLVPEPVQLWQSVERASDITSTINVLDEFYKDPSGLAYKFQHYVFMTRFIEETRSRRGNFDLRVMERSVFSDKNVFTAALYENGWLSDLELSLYHAWYSPMLKVGLYNLICQQTNHIDTAGIPLFNSGWLCLSTRIAHDMLKTPKKARTWRGNWCRCYISHFFAF